MKITSSKEVYKCSLFRVTEDRAVDAKTGQPVWSRRLGWAWAKMKALAKACW